MPTALLDEVETESTDLAKGKILALAKALGVPPQFLFYKELKIEPNLPDFRTPGNSPAVLTGAGLARIERARSIIAYLDDAVFENDVGSALSRSASVKSQDNATAQLQKIFSPVRRTDGSVDPAKTWGATRVAVERAGVIVLCDNVANDSFRGFCFVENERIPLILVNTSGQRPATKLFTLMHEIVHVIIGKTGVSDPSILKNSVETFCNRVTASVMMPEDEFVEAYAEVDGNSPRSLVNDLAYQFGVSKTAAAIRVDELGLDEGFYGKWFKTLPKSIPPIEEEDEAESSSGGGGIASQIGRFGYLLPKVLGGAIGRHDISVYDAYRLTHLKPHTFQQLATIGENKLEH